MDGFNYPVDVYNDTTYLGTLEAKPDGFVIKILDTPTGKTLIKKSGRNKFKSEQLAGDMLLRIWRNARSGTEPSMLREIARIGSVPPVPSQSPIEGPNLLIPDYDHEGGGKYPGDIKPGYYDDRQVVELLLYHLGNPDALQFIANMMETGIPEKDTFAMWLRKNKNNKPLLMQVSKEWFKHISGS